jgi:hypothetical protein
MLNDVCNSYENITVKKLLLRDDGESNVKAREGKTKIENHESRGQCCNDGCIII